MKKRTSILFALIMALAMIFAACGGGEPDTASASAETQTEAASSAATETSKASAAETTAPEKTAEALATEASAAEEAAETEAPETEPAEDVTEADTAGEETGTQPQEGPDPSAAGTYIGYAVALEDGDCDITGFYENEFYLELNEDGTGISCVDGEVSDMQWTLEGEELTVTDGSGPMKGTLREGIIRLNCSAFVTVCYVKEGVPVPEYETFEDDDEEVIIKGEGLWAEFDPYDASFYSEEHAVPLETIKRATQLLEKESRETEGNSKLTYEEIRDQLMEGVEAVPVSYYPAEGAAEKSASCRWFALNGDDNTFIELDFTGDGLTFCSWYAILPE